MNAHSDYVPVEGGRSPQEPGRIPVGGSGPTLLGDFELRRVIGRGGMGTVYEAWQRSLDRIVAVKVLSQQVSASATAVTRFQREAQAAAKLHHTHIVPIFAFGEDSGVYYYAMEMIDGPGLNTVISQARTREGRETPDDVAETVLLSRVARASESASNGVVTADEGNPQTPAPPEQSGSGVTLSDTVSLRQTDERYAEVADHIAEVADALDFAHRQGVIHRDIKPHNLLLSSEGKLMISDFGLARLSEQPGVTVTGEVIGSPLYMAPEQLSGETVVVDHRADIYALGTTMYEWLALTPPYPGDTRERVISRILTSEAPTLSWHNPDIPVDLETICLKAIDRDPARRYQTAGEFRDDLRRFLEHRPIRARRANVAVRALKFVARHQLVSLATAAALVAMTLGWALLSKGRDLKSQTAAVVEVEEDRERLLDDILSLMPAEIGGPVRLAEAAVPMLQGVVGASSTSGGAAGGADPAAVATAGGISRRLASDLYAVLAPDDWPPRPVDPTDEDSKLVEEAVGLWDEKPVVAVDRMGMFLHAHPDDFEAQQFQTALLGRLGQGRQMLEHADTLVRLHPQDARVYLWRGVAHLLLGDAVSCLRDLSHVDQPGELAAWRLTLRSLALAKVGAALEAFLSLNDALETKPDLVVALLARASVQASAGNVPGAVADLSRVIEIEPANADALGLRGDRYVELGDYEAAAVDYDRAMSIAGRTPAMVLRYLYARSQGHGAAKSSGLPSASSPTVRTGVGAPTSDSSGGSLRNWIRRHL